MKPIRVAIALALCLASQNALADTKADIARCAAIASPTERLICFDNLTTKLGVSGGKSVSTPPPSKGRGKWNVRIETSPIDDSKNVYLGLPSSEQVKSGYNTAQPTLVARCKENKTEVFVTWDLYLGMEQTDVLSRLDSEPATTYSWTISTDYKATFYGGNDIEFLRQLLKHQKLLLQVTPYGESPVMASFNLQGLAEAMLPLQEACKWR